MSPPCSAPDGFEVLESSSRILLADSRFMDSLVEAGLNDPVRWQALLADSARRAGRGSTASLDLPGGKHLLLKRLLRGGLTGRLRKESFMGSGRLLRNLETPIEAAARGIPTPAPVALLLVPGPRAFFRGWLAVEEIPGSRDLSTRFASECPPSPQELAEVMRVVRLMHDAGLDHRDLNLGNLLLRAPGDGGSEVFVIDLDKARLTEKPLRFGRRQAALRRLERSYVKQVERSGRKASKVGRDRWYELYAAGDAGLRERLVRGRLVGRLLLATHRMRWFIGS